jgi:acyl-phosphate glycerol 3-phosphate acyltransferase
MTGLLLVIFAVLISYLVGAIPFGYLIARWRGVDILKVGSGNIGATNVGRVLGRRFGLLVFVLDFAKGAIPAGTAILLRNSLRFSEGSGNLVNALPVLAGLASFVGHLFPIFLRFRGGKGVATGAGVVAVLLPGPTFAAFITWIVIVGLTHYVSLASLAAGTSLCLFHLLLTPNPFASENWVLTCFAFFAVGLVFVRHRANIKRLLQGNENRLPESPLVTEIPKTLHVLAVGLWFGSTVFFLIATLVIFRTFESLGTSAQRPSWIPLPTDFDKDMGTRLAGVAVTPLFDWYFPLQVICGLLAALTALTFSQAEPDRRLHRLRNVVLLLAMTTVVIGWPIADYVGELRLERYSSDETLAQSAKALFGAWHGISLLLNMITIGLVTLAMALAAQWPRSKIEDESEIENRPADDPSSILHPRSSNSITP